MLRRSAFAFSRNRAIFAMERNFGRFWAVLALIIFHLGKIWGKLDLSTRNLSFPKFVPVVQKLQLLASIRIFILDATGLEWLD